MTDTAIESAVPSEQAVDARAADQERLVRGVIAIRIERGPIGELHHAAEFVSLAARREVVTYEGLKQPRDLALQRGDRGCGPILPLQGHVWLPAKREHVNEHGFSLPHELSRWRQDRR